MFFDYIFMCNKLFTFAAAKPAPERNPPKTTRPPPANLIPGLEGLLKAENLESSNKKRLLGKILYYSDK